MTRRMTWPRGQHRQGRFDAVDIDRIDSFGKAQAADLRTFVIKDADGHADITALVTAATALAAAATDRAAFTDPARDAVKAGFTAALTTAETQAGAAVFDVDGILARVSAAYDALAAAADAAADAAAYATALAAFEALVAELDLGLRDLDAEDVAAGDAPDADRPAAGNALQGAHDDAKTVKKGTYGWLHVNRYSGEWEYHLDNAAAAAQALNGGQTAGDEFTITVTDEAGAAVDRQVRVSLTGENDAPWLFAAAPGGAPRTPVWLSGAAPTIARPGFSTISRHPAGSVCSTSMRGTAGSCRARTTGRCHRAGSRRRTGSPSRR